MLPDSCEMFRGGAAQRGRESIEAPAGINDSEYEACLAERV